MTASLKNPERPRLWLRWLGGAALLVCLWLLAREASAAVGPRLPPALVWLGVVGTLGALIANFAVGHAVCLLALGILASYWSAHPSLLPAELALRSNLLGLTCATQLFVVGYGATVRFLSRRVREQQQRIEQRLTERAELTRALNVDLSRSVEALRRELHAPRPMLPALRAAQNELHALMERARLLLHIRPEPELTVESVLPDFRRRMTRVLLGVSLFNIVVTMVRVRVTGKGPLAPTLVVFAITFAVLIGTELRPRWRQPLIAVLTGLTMLAIVRAFFYWGFKEPPPNILFLVTIGYNGIVMGSRRAPLVILALSLAVQAALVYAGVAATPWGAQLMLCVAAWTLLHQLGWFLLEARVHAALRTAQERAAELKVLDAFRTRIGGTLFHDVANPVQVIGMLLEFCAGRDALSAKETETLLRFHERLAALVSAAFEVLEHGDLVARERIASTPVFGMFLELHELFEFRLRAKAQTLSTQGDDKLRVLTIPELLRDSVLANLLSNAIKFSPEGATIELSAARMGAEAEIVVRDHGPGWPAELLRRLAEGKRPDSTPGTAGEQGLGLGLSLASEHVRRMGGSLSLRVPSEGEGGEAAVRVPVA